MSNDTPSDSSKKKQNPFVDLIVSIVIPSLILMKLSGPEKLGPTWGLIVALSFPIGWGLYELIKNKKFNYVALLGVISVLLTGGIGLLQIDAKWLAVKEAAVPAVIGIGVLIADKLGFPVMRKLLYNPAILNTKKINRVLDERGNTEIFDKRLANANYLFAGTFVFSSIMNFLLAKWIVKSESGTTAFNEELGRMTLLSYPVIAIPSMIMMLAIFFLVWRTISRLTDLKFEEIMVTENDSDDVDSDSGNGKTERPM